jgi:hypothetical protein
LTIFFTKSKNHFKIPVSGDFHVKLYQSLFQVNHHQNVSFTFTATNCYSKKIVMKKITLLLLTATTLLILPGCKKIIESIKPVIPNEPTVTAIGVPVGNIVTKTIGKTGGSIASADGNAELIFPSGALDNDKSISIQAVTNQAPNGVGNAYRFLPEGIKFLQPVTLKFHYTAKDLASTLADLMGIAFQDSTGGWWRVNNFINDSVNRVISAPIKHFTDYTSFDILFINPPGGNLKVSKSMNLEIDIVVSDDDLLTKLDPHADEDLAPLTQVSDKKIAWSANGVVNGNSTFGTLTATDSRVTSYKAPAKIPSRNPVAVSAQVDVKFKYHGKTFDKTSLVSNIKIVGIQEKYLFEMKLTDAMDPEYVYTDTVSMNVVVDDTTVTVSDINNFAAKTNPTSWATQSGCTKTFVPDGLGKINIYSATGQLFIIEGISRILRLEFKNTGTYEPTFSEVCPQNPAFTLGGGYFPGFPGIDFELFSGGPVFEQRIDNGTGGVLVAKLSLQ